MLESWGNGEETHDLDGAHRKQLGSARANTGLAIVVVVVFWVAIVSIFWCKTPEPFHNTRLIPLFY